jgi:hypothetical protein
MPIYVCDPSLGSQAMPWEAMRKAPDFVALLKDQRLARMVLGSAPNAGGVRSFERELRILAVLAAAGTDPKDPDADPLTSLDELAALVAGLKTLPPEVGLQVRVVGCDKAVRDAVAALNDPRFTFEFVASAENDQATLAIFAATAAMQPHVVHFFCHGQAGNPPRLELATALDQEMGRVNGSAVLEPDALGGLLERAPGIWLAVLNCCLGAAPTRESPGLARVMVLDGFPAAVGMQEPIDRVDAHRFTGAFYEALCQLLAEALAAPQPVEIDWPKAMIAPRQHLCRARVGVLSKAGQTKAWTLPVLYVGRSPMSLQVLAPAAAAQPAPPGQPAPVPPAAPTPSEVTELQAELATLVGMRAELAAASAPPVVLQKVDARIAELRQKLAIP